MILFFVLLGESNEKQDDVGEPYETFKAHCFPVNIHPINANQIYELMNHVANHLLKRNSGNFLSMIGEDTVALQTHRPENEVG